MRERLINVGQKSFVNFDEIICIVSADAEKVRKFLNRWQISKDSMQVINLTSDQETRSMIIFKNGTIGLSSVNATVLAKRANDQEPKT